MHVYCFLAMESFAEVSLVRVMLLLALVGTNAAYSSSSLSSFPVLNLLSNESLIVSRNDFPASFKFGALTWSFKHEAASFEDGKSDGLWDAFARQKGTIIDESTPESGGDHYHRYPEDIDLLADLGMDSFRFSIAWPRMFPNGTGEVNALAVEHYNNVINRLIDTGIEPFVTLYEQDLPQVLQDSYGGLLSPLFIDDFVHFANACFSAFGDRVKHWMTFEEGNDFVPFGYASSYCPPGRCTAWVDKYNCTEGNSSTEPYIAGHNLLRAHAAAAELYRKEYQPSQQGQIGMALWFRWFEPLTNSTEDKQASERGMDFAVGWFVEPLLYGDYPNTMKEIVGSRLPSFTEEESAQIRGSVDFIGLNSVTSRYATVAEGLNISSPGYYEDWHTTLTGYRDGVPIGRNDGDFFVPWTMEKVFNYMRTRYDNVPTYLTALGYGLNSESLDDDVRVEFFALYLKSLLKGIRDGADVRGMYAWSLMDGFETIMGKVERFGLFYVDDSNRRFARKSALWFKDMLTSNTSLTSKS